TRDRYRHVVESIARRSTMSEHDVARTAIRLASEANGRARHVGHFLIGTGRRAVERAVHMRRSYGQVARDTSQAVRHYVYGGAIAAVTAIATVVLARALPIQPTLGWY